MPDAPISTADHCSYPYRVRFDEGAPDGLARTSTLLRYAQDLAWDHSGRHGFTRAWYREQGLTWLARAAEVGVVGPLAVGDEIVGTTFVQGWRRVWARRRTEFRDGAGALVAWTHVDWVLIDGRGAPARIPPTFAVFGASDATFPLGRVALDAAPSEARHDTIAVRPQELDPLDHVNNAVYADWVDEQVTLADGDAGSAVARAIPRTMRLEYARAAEPGAVLTASTWPDPMGAGWSCRIAVAGGTDVLRAHLAPDIDGSPGR